MNLTVAIIGHGSDQATFDAHLPFWEAVNPALTVWCPEDDPVKSDHEVFLAGQKGRATNDSIRRLSALIQWAHRTSPRNDLLIFEYDSICLSPIRLRPLTGGIRGNTMLNIDARFIAPRYLNPPWLFSADVLGPFLKTAGRFALFEQGEVDRWISAIAFLAQIPMLDYEPRGFSRGTIGHEHFADLHAAIYSGATMIHGIKSQTILNQVTKVYEFCKNL